MNRKDYALVLDAVGQLAPEAILASLAVGVIALDEAGTVVYLNRAAEQISGVERGKALGRSCREVLQSSLCEGECPFKQALGQSEPRLNLDAVLIRQRGRSVSPIKVSASRILAANGRVAGGVVAMQPYTLGQMLKPNGSRHWGDFIGESPAIRRVFDVLQVAAPSNTTILIEGPTGTGKDLLANIIHRNSPRADQPMIKVNCAAIPENLLESELFGYRRGAFTGADRDKPGRFELANGGTIFLDEISEMPLALQAKLLRVIEDREFYPLGSRSTVRVDVRILAACNRPLAGQVAAGQFREDLYYRLNVIRLYIPPLKDRPQDLPPLIRRIIQRKNLERGTYICRFSPEALDLLLNHDYPGNVRELENILEHACLLCRGDFIREDHLPWSLTGRRAAAGPPPSAGPGEERQRLLEALERAGWRREIAARALGIERTTLWRKMKRLGITSPNDKRGA